MVGGRRIRGESCLKRAGIKGALKRFLDLEENANEGEDKKRGNRRKSTGGS